MKTFAHKAKAQNLNWEDIQEMQQKKKREEFIYETDLWCRY